MLYVPFTEEQKLLAGSVDLPTFLARQNVALKRSGREWALESDPYIKIHGNNWYDQAERRGGNAISFVKRFYNLEYPGAVKMLLGDAYNYTIEHVPTAQPPKGKKAFTLPPAHTNMRRVYAYLIQQRKIPAWLVSNFAKAGILYESAIPSKDGTKEYHNAVFVGRDGKGVSKHAQMHGLASAGDSWHSIIEGSDAAYSFHHTGASDRLFVFEAPIDMLSFIALHPDNWEQNNYVALCGLSEHALLRMLELNSQTKQVVFCLDNDARGIVGRERLERIVTAHSNCAMEVLVPENKDWNEDIGIVQG